MRAHAHMTVLQLLGNQPPDMLLRLGGMVGRNTASGGAGGWVTTHATWRQRKPSLSVENRLTYTLMHARAAARRCALHVHRLRGPCCYLLSHWCPAVVGRAHAYRYTSSRGVHLKQTGRQDRQLSLWAWEKLRPLHAMSMLWQSWLCSVVGLDERVGSRVCTAGQASCSI